MRATTAPNSFAERARDVALTVMHPTDGWFDRLVRNVTAALQSADAAAFERGRRSGIDFAIEVIMGGRFLHDEAPTKLFAREVTAAIKREDERAQRALAQRDTEKK